MKNDIELIRTWMRGPGRAAEIIALIERRLNCVLPACGFLAGQSVASAIAELMGTGGFVYNDADVFLIGDEWGHHVGETSDAASHRVNENRNKKVSATCSFSDRETCTFDDYRNSMGVASRSLYSVRATRVMGPLNYVLISWFYDVELARAAPSVVQSARLERLIGVFDINSTQVGIDLATHELTASEAFLQFLATNELRMTQLFTPTHSLLRYLRKKVELQAYGNDAAHLEMVLRRLRVEQGDRFEAQARLLDFSEGRVYFREEHVAAINNADRSRASVQYETVGTGRYCAPLAFGPKYFRMAKSQMSILESRFELVKSSKGALWMLSAKGESTLEDAMSIGVTPAAQLKGAASVAKFWEGFLPASKHVRSRRERFSRVLAGVNHPNIVDQWLSAEALLGNSYIDGLDSDSDALRYQKLVNEHQEVAEALLALPLQQQVTTARAIVKNFKDEGFRPIWGLLRGLRLSDILKLADSREAVRQLLERHAEQMGVQIQTKLPLPEAVNGVTVKELVSGLELLEEGSRMSHCVGGYSSALRSGSSRIISLSAGPKATDCATVEWRFSTDRAIYESVGDDRVYAKKVELGQNRTFANRAPLEILVEVERLLREKLNLWLAQNIQQGRELLLNGQ